MSGKAHKVLGSSTADVTQRDTGGVHFDLAEAGRRSELHSNARHSQMFRATPPGVCCTFPGTEPQRVTSASLLGVACVYVQVL